MDNNEQKGVAKTIYLDKEALDAVLKVKEDEKRSVSDIINTILRKEFGIK